MKKRVPYGVSNYAELITDQYYYVDKSRYIAEIERIKQPLFLRPRRFGKSLFCSMLEYYYDHIHAERFQELFGDTDIGRAPTPRHNQYAVLSFDFSAVDSEVDLPTLEQRFRDSAITAYINFFSNQKLPIPTDLTAKDSAAQTLDRLIATLAARGLPQLYIIIDEYDNFTNQLIISNKDDTYYDATGKNSFLKNFYKVIKKNIKTGLVANCFITGVLPVTMDDLTSGYNIASNVTLDTTLHDMLGFTEDESRAYISQIFTDYGYDQSRLDTVLERLRVLYDGYRFTLRAPNNLFNSTISNYYLFNLLRDGGEPPQLTADPNLDIDLGWIQRLAGTSQAALQYIQNLLTGQPIIFSTDSLNVQFNMRQFLTPEYLPASLFFLGQLTWKEFGVLGFPNLTVRIQFLRKYNELAGLSRNDLFFAELFLRYAKDGDLAAVFRGYWEHYIQVFNAQAFDHITESFYSMTFYYYCQALMDSRCLPTLEEGLPSGRADVTFLEPASSPRAGTATVIEFKHFKASDQLPDAPRAADLAQTNGYAANLARRHACPVHAFLFYARANHDYHLFPLATTSPKPH